MTLQAYRKDEFHRMLVDLLGVSTEERVLDVGCGTGDTLPHLSAAVGPNGFVVGMDVLPLLLTKATRHQSRNVRLVLADAEKSIPFCDNTFRRVLCNNVLECLRDKPHFLRECLRVMLPGGSLLMAHFDFDSVVLHSSLPDITRKLIHGYADEQQPWMAAADGQLGRKLPAILRQAGIDCVEFGIVLFGEQRLHGGYAEGMLADMRLASPRYGLAESEVQQWWEDLLALDTCGDFLFTIQWMYARCRA